MNGRTKGLFIQLLYLRTNKGDINMNDKTIQHVIDSLPVLIAYVGSDEKYRYVNDEYKKWLGIDIEDVVGRSISDVLGNDRYERIKGHVQMALLGKEVSYEVSMPENEIFFARYIPFISSDGSVDGFSVLVEDITENKLLEEEKNKLVEELQTALSDIKILKGTIPICSYCNSIRDDEGAWNRLEVYISKHSEAAFSHGVCPNCLVKARVEAGLVKE